MAHDDYLATSFPIHDPEGVVTEGHATYCRTHGHAPYVYNGIVSTYCPRCGELKVAACILDDNSIRHNYYCSQQALCSTQEQADANNVDREMPWGIPVLTLTATWLSDGTVTCVCAESYLPIDHPTR